MALSMRLNQSTRAASRPCHAYRAGPLLSRVVCKAGSGQTKLQSVLASIDQLNSQDPRTVQVDGKPMPYELAYSRWLTEWAQKLTADGNPPASDEIVIVARGQHVQRWTSPRSSYPEGKAGYLKWREDLKHFHAKVVLGIMKEAGYSPESMAKVESIILKKNIKEAENQIIEDALCLVFLERQLTEMRLKEPADLLVDILRKTWTRKMSEKGRAAALALPLCPEDAALVGKALGA
eukprot:CAMPEP_0119101082 /NCGR_PEP_ID=MMETSP1180-20130426/218_1 /TAXON_ID=3052 ORGANISM="Chlamydomonas cf sp, Strain CCMP681" /NCGR_SAMPLE_ID=MMETSP1180 /ASSEMBLY_ACC=CAM_ASM_000741 /LENGTH=234 /DNA_ID=CAMNT_0007085131 /DNA_START=6 /DNA_END=710 /DNA_ORIENTATION=-